MHNISAKFNEAHRLGDNVTNCFQIIASRAAELALALGLEKKETAVSDWSKASFPLRKWSNDLTLQVRI